MTYSIQLLLLLQLLFIDISGFELAILTSPIIRYTITLTAINSLIQR